MSHDGIVVCTHYCYFFPPLENKKYNMPVFNDTIDTIYRFPITNKVARTTKNPAYKSGNATMVRRVIPVESGHRDNREEAEDSDTVSRYTCTCQ